MKTKTSPPPDHLIPISWLVNTGVTEAELDTWIKADIAIRTIIHGGAQFISFPSHRRPVKFKEVKELIDNARGMVK